MFYLSNKIPPPFFVVSLTVHLSITLANDQLDAQIFNTFITVLYMFRACSSSGHQIVLVWHLVLSLSVSDRPVHRLRKNWITPSLTSLSYATAFLTASVRCPLLTFYHLNLSLYSPSYLSLSFKSLPVQPLLPIANGSWTYADRPSVTGVSKPNKQLY
jgi:hypothetical protein